ncbi:MAG: lysophospholipase [Actinobacteria bacterium]|nr:lysophospholipase [Actinomycetota bacterium]
MADLISREVVATRVGVTLAGSVWERTRVSPTALVIMHPGSGPSNRRNDGYFDPLRDELVDAGLAVAAFDKRGVGRSTGRWQEAGIEAQASDLLAELAALEEVLDLAGLPVGLFGHSQGGWVVIDAASRHEGFAFVIVNSGPGVTPAVQERFAARVKLEQSGATSAEVESGMSRYDEMVGLARAGAPFNEARGHHELADFVPEEDAAWRFWTSIADYDPARALRDVRAPVLALFGGEDRIVPVEDSIEVFRAVVPPNRLTVEVFEGADHRIQVGDPPRFAPGYVETILGFLGSYLV